MGRSERDSFEQVEGLIRDEADLRGKEVKGVSQTSTKNQGGRNGYEEEGCYKEKGWS